MFEFILGFASFWLAVGLFLHVLILFRNWKFIRRALSNTVHEFGSFIAAIFFVSTFVWSVIVWPHVFFKAKQ
jgi:hypothetical protein